MRLLRCCLALFTFAVLSMTSMHEVTHAQDPLEGLSHDVRQLVGVLNSGDDAAVAARLASGPIIRTAYPGDGVEVTREVAAADFAWMIVSNRAVTDGHGSGLFRAVAVWMPANDPDSVLIAASGVDSSGLRITTVFGTDAAGTAITSYGRAGDLGQLLEVWEAQGDLRLLPEAPLPPDTGTSSATDARGGDHTAGLVVAAVVAALALVAGGWALRERPH
jgi:hypothetical protein